MKIRRMRSVRLQRGHYPKQPQPSSSSPTSTKPKPGSHVRSIRYRSFCHVTLRERLLRPTLAPGASAGESLDHFGRDPSLSLRVTFCVYEIPLSSNWKSKLYLGRPHVC